MRFLNKLYPFVGIFCLVGNAIFVSIYFLFFLVQSVIILIEMNARPQVERSGWEWTRECMYLFAHCGLIVFSYAMSRYLEKQLQLFLFLKFQSKMIKSHEIEQHRPVQKIYMTEDFVWMTAIWHQNYKPYKSMKTNSQLHFIFHWFNSLKCSIWKNMHDCLPSHKLQEYIFGLRKRYCLKQKFASVT